MKSIAGVLIFASGLAVGHAMGTLYGYSLAKSGIKQS